MYRLKVHDWCYRIMEIRKGVEDGGYLSIDKHKKNREALFILNQLFSDF